MRSLLGIGGFRYRSIRAAASVGVMPRHKGAGKKSNVTIKHDDPRMIHLRNHFDYLHKLGEVRATKVIATAVMERVVSRCVIRIENRAKVNKALKEDKTVGIMTDDDAFGRKKKKVPEIKEELKRLGLRAHGKKAELVARSEEHLSTEPSQAE